MAINAGPDLVEILPNDGAPLVSGDVRHVSPRELLVRFDSTQVLDPATLGAIQISRSGGDNLFDPASPIADIPITPAVRELGERSNEVVLRFSDRLPDDLFRIHIVGAGAAALENTDGQAFNGGADLNIDFRLDQGTQVVGVVPQPVFRVGNALTYSNPDVLVGGSGLNQIEVYFDAEIAQLVASTGPGGVRNPAYYQLLFTNGSVSTADDLVFNPTTVHLPATAAGQTKVVLEFNPADLAHLDAGATVGTYRLRIGDATAPLPAPLPTIVPGADPGSSFATALNLGALGPAAQIITGQTDVQTYGLTLPGGDTDPGHRDVPGVSHLAAPGDTTTGITTIYYDFRNDYGRDPSGNTLSNQILLSPTQQQRVREIFDLYSHYLGVQFVETTPAPGVPSVPGSITVAVGLLSAVNPAVASGLGGPTGIAGVPNPAFPAFSSRLVVMDNADFSGAAINQFGARFTRDTMQQIGSLLGFGVAHDLPDLTVNAPNPSLFGNTGEPIFPGDADILHGQHLFRPESNDIDLFRFDVAAGQHGVFTAETTAERLLGALGASSLDTVLSLYGEVTVLSMPLGIAINDGNHFTISDGLNPAVTFEFNNFGTVTAGRRPVNFLASDSSEQIATKVAAAIRGVAGLDVEPIVQGDQIRLLGVSSVNLANAPFVTQETSLELLSRNDDYYSEDSFVQLRLRPGTYYVGVTSTGNEFNPEIANSGFGGTTDGRYELRLEFRPDSSNNLIDASGVLLDGDGDGRPGGVFNFHFQASTATNTIYVDKVASNIGQLGTLTNPFNSIQAAVTAANGTAGRDIIRIVANGGDVPTGGDGIVSTTGDNITYELGFNSSGGALSDGSSFRVPQGTTVMIDPGVIIKLRQANIEVGSTSTAVAGDRSLSHLQVLGVPGPGGEVLITSYHNEAIGKDVNPTITNPARGDWGGLVFRNDVDRSVGRPIAEDQGVFLNYVNHASLSYGGGQLQVGADLQTFNSIYMIESRPTVSNNAISLGADAALSADPNSFADTRFQGTTFTADYDRVGPDIHGNRLTNNSFNALFVRIETAPGQLRSLDTWARWDDTDVVHMLSENLVIRGTVGGPLDPDGPGGLPVQARLDGRLNVDPGVIVKLQGSRIETQFGAQFLAEGTAEDPVRFVSLLDDDYGIGGTFDTNNDGIATTAAQGNWGGMYFGYLSQASIDHARITHAGGETTIEGGFGRFNAVEIHRADVRIANSTLAIHATGLSATDRNGRGINDATVIFVRGAQPVLINNRIHDNAPVAISIDVNSLHEGLQADPGRTTGGLSTFDQFQDNAGPLVRLNRMDRNFINGMNVRTGTLTTAGVWDDTDIVHVVRDTITVTNVHSTGGLRVQSSGSESLVVKLFGQNAGFTITGRQLDIEDRIGGSVQLVGTPGHPVVLTSLGDDSVGAGLNLNGEPLLNTGNSGQTATSITGSLSLIQPDPFVGATLVGNIGMSTDGLGVAGAGQIQANVPPGSTVALAFLHVATTTFGPIGFRPASITFQGQVLPITWLPNVGDSGANFETGRIDVTSIVRSVVGSGGGIFNFNVDETVTGNSGQVDGTSLTVIYTNPNLPLRTALVLEGGLTGATPQTNTIRFTNPIDLSDPQFTASLALGIEFSFQSGPFTQFSQVDINGQRLTTSAGNADDAVGVPFNGNLLTMGGIGDNPANPTNPLITNDPDDELYTLTPLLTNGATQIQIQTSNPSNDDSIFLAAMLLSGNVSLGGVGEPGDWRSVQLQQFSNDRNVDTLVEREPVSHTATPANNTTGTAQLLGELAPNLLSGSDDRRLGFQVQGFLGSGDRDVYSFFATAGTEIWLDIDRTTSGLDTVLELMDETGTVLARSNNSAGGLAESDLYNVEGFITNVGPGSNAGRRMQRDAFTQASTSDLFTSNIHDAGMRVVLPFLNGAVDRYFVRVRSNSSDLTNLDGGRTTGAYQLQVRLQEADEFPGSTVQYSNLRFATNALDIQGLPKHSPLLGDTAERTTDAADELFAGALPIGNVLQTDRGALSVAGSLFNSTDVDWYSFTLDHDLVPALTPATASRTWSTIFDIDYADGLSRPDTGIAVYASTGELLFIGRDSDLLDDRDAAGNTTLSAGSNGLKDPFIGSAQLPAGQIGSSTRQYLVAVFSNAQIPNALNATFTVGSTNRTVRMEPVNSVERVAEDHIGVSGYTSGQPATGTNVVGPQTSLFDIASVVALQTNVRPLTLSDVPLYLSTGTTVQTVDPATGAFETNVGTYVGGVQTLRDIAFRSDGRLHGVDASPGGASDPAFLTLINPGTAARTVVGGDNLTTLADSLSALTYLRTGLNAGAPTYELYYASGDNAGGSRLVRANYLNGSATGAAPVNSRPLGVLGTGIFSAAPGDHGVTTGLAFIGQTLYGVSNSGRLYTIDVNSGRVAADLADMPGIAFAGLSLGPQNLDFNGDGAGGDLARTLFAVAADGRIFAFDEFGAPAILFDTDANNLPDASSIGTGVNIPAGETVTGLAFSPLDYNLWHPTLRGRTDPGHGTTTPFDGSRSPTLTQPVINGRTVTEGEAAGGASFYFGLENHVANPDAAGSTSYFDYGVNAQFGILTQEAHQDLVGTTGVLANTYDLPGGAFGSLVTNPFSLQGYAAGDKPTLYFNYLLRTENANTSTPGLMRDSARVFVSADGGVTWSMVATNNSIRDGQGELPQFFTANSQVPGGDPLRQRVQELFETPTVADRTWRQARVDLGEFAGQGNLLLRFDFSTAGTTNQGLPGDVFGDFSSTARNQNNAFEGFYVDDILIGFAERGEMVTTAPTDQRAFVQPPIDPNAPPQTLNGAYQLEVRRGTEYATAVPVAGTVVRIDPALVLDTNDRLVQGFNITAADGSSVVDGQTIRISDGITSVVFEFDVDGSVVDSESLRSIDFLPGDSAATVAQKVRDAINAHVNLNVVATVIATSNIVELFGAAEVNVAGPAPVDLTVSISADSMSESGGSAMVTVTRSGSTANPLNVVLTSDDPSEVSLPAPFQIPAGWASMQVPITALNDLLADGTQTVQILATAVGYDSISDTIDILDASIPALTVVVNNPRMISENGGTTTVTVSRNTPINVDLLVSLPNGDPSEIAAPATLLIPAGSASATFTIDAQNDPVIDGDQTVAIVAYADGFRSGSDFVVVLDDDGDPPPTLVSSVGLNFNGTNSTQSPFIPPDTMGAVGINHIVEFLNGRYAVYDKTTGAQLFASTFNAFWTAAGANVIGNLFDPRIVYDPTVNRWFAAAINSGNANTIYVGVSITSDPTAGWRSVQFIGDTLTGTRFNDYETLAVDADGVYLATNNFSAGFDVSIFSIPKVDLLAATPTAARLTRFMSLNAATFGDSIQPALDFGPSDGRAALFSTPGGNRIVRTDVLGAGGAGATLSAPINITVPAYSAAPQGRQPGPNDNIENVTPRLTGNAVEVGNSVWMAHAVLDPVNGGSAVRWYEISEATSALLQTGLISDPNLDFYDASIAANANGDVVIGFSGSGNAQFISSYVAVGFTSAGVTTFGAPQIVTPGGGSYFVDFGSGRNRWGDYSATVIDPVNPNSFWTFQEYAPSTNTWQINIANILTVTEERDLVVSINLDSVAEGGASTATVTRVTSDLSQPLTVTFTSSDTSEALNPVSVVIPAGAASAPFTVQSVNDFLADGNQTVIIRAAASGFNSVADRLDVLDVDVPRLTVTVNPMVLNANGSGTATVTVTRNSPTVSALPIRLLSNDLSEARVPDAPSSVTAAASSTSFNGGSGLSPLDNFYNGKVLTFTSGGLGGQSATIVGYAGATRTFTFAPGSFSATPAIGDSFAVLIAIIPAGQNSATFPIEVLDEFLPGIDEVTAGVVATAASSTSFTSNGLSPVDDFYNGRFLTFTSGPLAGQTATVLDYQGATGTFTFAPGSFTAAPTPGNAFLVLRPVVITAKASGFASGSDTFFTEDGANVSLFDRRGDENLDRPQGQVIIANNRIGNSSQIGIRVNALEPRAIAAQPHPGAVRNLGVLNPTRLAPGITIENNVVANSGTGAILFSGDVNTAPNPQGATQFGRIVNNTLYGGGTATGIGIQVTEAASPTMLNNIVSNFATGILVDATALAAGTILGGTVYKGNATDVNTGALGTGSFPMVLTATDPLFINPAQLNFGLVQGSIAIDSSINVVPERPELDVIYTALGILASPVTAPLLDITGRLRVDNPFVDSPPGLGANVFKDRGAIERLDPVLMSVEDLTVTEGDATVNAFVLVRLSEPVNFPLTVLYTTSSGTADAGVDFTSTSGTLTFAASQTTQFVTVPVLGDTRDEFDETFFVTISNLSPGALIGDAQGQVTIEDNDPLPAFSINDLVQDEADVGTTNFVFTVTLSSASGKETRVSFVTRDGTAIAGSDYQSTSGTLTFAPNTTVQTLTVRVLGDALIEGNETFFVDLSNPVEATLLDSIGMGTITDDEPVISISGITVTEGNTGLAPATNAVFTVSLNKLSQVNVSFDFTTLASATIPNATAGSDYVASSGTTTIPAGVMSINLTVQVNGDTLGEPDEFFDFRLSNVTNAKFSSTDPQPPNLTVTAKIVDDEPRITITDVTINPEGNGGAKDAVFSVVLDRPSPAAAPVTVLFATANGTAVAGADYSTTNGLLSFSAGQLTQFVTVSVLGDLLDENDETFFLNLSGETNALLSDNQGLGTIVDDDALPSVTISDFSSTEGDSGTTNFVFPVQLSAESGRTVLVAFATAPGTAASGLDYVASSGTLTFTAGQTSQNITVQVIGDPTLEPDETFVVDLSIPAPATATLGDPQALGTILDDEGRVTITGVTQTEGTGGTTNFVFDVVLNKRDAANNVVVSYATADGGGPNPARGTPPLQDYLPAAGSLTFAPGAGGPVTQKITVQVVGDTNDEFDETFLVNLSSAESFRLSNNQATGLILDDDGPPSISILDTSVAEGDTGVSNAVFDVVLSSVSSMQVTVVFATANGTVNPALAGVDYNSTTSTLTFLPGQSTQKITVQALGDLEGEVDETFFVNLSGAVNATIADNQGLGTIVDNEPRVTVTGVTVTEADAALVQAEFLVRLSKPSDSGQIIRVVYSTEAGAGPAFATDGADYTGTAGATLTFSPGETVKSVFIPVLPDLLDEDEETFSLRLNSATNALVQVNLAEGRIIDNDPLPVLSINDISVTEGNAGQTNAVLTLSLSAASGRQVSVAYATADGTATTADGDYLSASGNVVFAPGEVTKQITVAIVGDNRNEPSETVLVNLSSNVNATLPDTQGVVTINDDEPRISILDPLPINEQDAGSQGLVFEVRLDRTYGEAVTVRYDTANGTATAPADYTGASGTVTFGVGVTAQFITVAVQGDLLDELDETFAVNLSNASPNALISDGVGQGTIVDNDAPPTVSILDTTVVEGNIGNSDAVFRLLLSTASGLEVLVPFSTANNTATVSGNDYFANTGVVTFAPGATERFLTVQVRGDTLGEPNETFLVNLSTPVNATLSDGQAIGTIRDDEPRISVNDVTVTEADSTVNLVFTVSLDVPSSGNATVVYGTSPLTATAGVDYTSVGGTLTFQSGLGETQKTVTVQITGDLLDEADETFQLILSGESANAEILDNQGIGTILDNDGLPTLSIGDAVVNEGNSGIANLVFPVTLSAASGQVVSVQVNTADGTVNPATAGSDYVTISGGTVTFNPGETQKNVTVQVVGDRNAEPNETLFVNLVNPTSAGITDGQGLGTILDDEPVVSIDPVTVTEGNGDVSAVFLVRMDRASTETVTVTYSTQDGTAVAGIPPAGDYTAIPNATLSFTPGQVQTLVTVTVRGDLLNEQNETFSVTLSSVPTGNAKLGAASALGTILNDDPQPALAISSPAPVQEGNDPAFPTPLVFPVTLSSASGQVVSVVVNTVNGTAASPGDYDAVVNSTLVFAAGETQKFVTVQVRGDALGEPNETFLVQLQSPVNASVSTSLATGTIVDDEPRVSIDDIAITESEFAVTGVFTISLNQPATGTVSVVYSTAPGTATADVDYATITGGTVSFVAGESSKPVTVTVLGDSLDENNETFLVNLVLGTSNAVLLDGQGTATIVDNDPLPQLSINHASVVEGDGGTTSLVFDVTLSVVSGRSVTVNYATSPGTAATGTDFTAVSGAVSFAAGETRQQVTVPVVGDLQGEFDETFSVSLSAAANATILDGLGQGTIIDDDARLQIGDVVLTENDAGIVAAVFNVTLTETSPTPISVLFSTADGTALAGSDYQATSGSLSFAPGNAQLSVTVNVLGDLLDEFDETFFVNLSSPSGTVILDGQGLGTILDNDLLPALAISSISVVEGDTPNVTNAVFIVTLTPVSGRGVTVEFVSSPVTAAQNVDYAAVSGTLSFAAGQTQQQITVQVNGDLQAEANETFQINLFNALNANITTATGTGTILDDEPRLTINDVTVTETDGGSTDAVFTVSMDRVAANNVTVVFATANNTAAAGSDYTGTGGTLTFVAGATTAQITVSVLGDVNEEINETFFVNLSSASGAVVMDSQGLGTILDNDPRISINNVTVTELTGGTVAAVFTVSLSQAPDAPVTVAFVASSGTATAGADFSTAGGTLTFAVGQTQRTITVNVLGDALNEDTETFNVTLSGAVNGQIQQPIGVGTILDNDPLPQLSISDVSVLEGNSGAGGIAVFSLTLNAPSGRGVSMNVATAPGTAGGSDFTATAGIVSFAAGTTSAQFTVSITGDAIEEPDETFTLNVSSVVNATPPAAPGTATIIDDDPAVSIDDVTVVEPDTGTTVAVVFTVRLNKDVDVPVTMTFATVGDTAAAGQDFTNTSGTISFAPGQTTQKITVTVLGDLLDEPSETFDVNLTILPGSSGQAGDLTGRGTITDNDASPNLAIGNASVIEGNAGLRNIVFTATLSAVSGQQVTAVFNTANNTAQAGSDYLTTSGTLIIAAGQASTQVTVQVIGDTALESDETFFVNLSSGTGVSDITVPQGLGRIVNDDVRHIFVTGADAGGGPHVKVFESETGAEKFGFMAYNPAFGGGVRVAAGDVNGDAVPDIVTTPGFGGGPHVRVINGATGQPIYEFFALDNATKGLQVAMGDVNGDGRADIIIGTDGEPGDTLARVRVFDGPTGNLLRQINFDATTGMQTGVRVAAGDINGDGRADLILGSAVGVNSQVFVQDALSGVPLANFSPYPGFTGGIYVSGGDVNGDGRSDIITGAGAGGGPHVRIFNGADTSIELGGFMAYNPAFGGGVRVAATDYNGDGRGDVVTAAGPGGGPHVRIFSGVGFSELRGFFAYPNFTGGVNVGGSFRSVGAALQAASPAAENGSAASISQADVLPLLQRAIADWAAAGLDQRLLDRLASVEVRIADLPGEYLATAAHTAIMLDSDAAGHGWFVDSTPWANEEFELLSEGSLRARREFAAAAGMDLMTVLAHELGHILGLEHSELHGGGVMEEMLPAGTRRVPRAEDVDGLFAAGSWD